MSARAAIAKWMMGAALIHSPIAPGAVAAETLAEAPYGEGAVILDDALFYAEMGADRVMRLDLTHGPTGGRAGDPAGGHPALFWSEPGCGPTSFGRLGDNLIVACHLAGKLVRLAPDGTGLADIATDAQGRRLDHPNGMASDGQGGLYITLSGIFRATAPAAGAVYHLDQTLRLIRVADGLHYANGVVVTGDRAELLVSEHLARRVLRYAIAADGELTPRGVFFDFTEGLGAAQPRASFSYPLSGPDGLARDTQGRVYICDYGAGRILVASKEGDYLGQIDLPLAFVTSLALSADGRQIFVTATADHIAPYEPGAVLRLTNPFD